MIKWLRSIIGFNGLSRNRTVVGNHANINLKDVQYIQDSNTRLNLLNNLYSRYKGTPHEHKIKLVYEKTKSIHSYLVSRKRVYDLELFHIQNTDHFINTFSLIIDVHQRHQDRTIAPAKTGTNAGVILDKPEPEWIRRNNARDSQTQTVKSMSSQEAFVLTEEAEIQVPRLSVPEISIDTYAKITYVRLDTTGNLISSEISITSTDQEKESFLSAISARLGVYKLDISYVGNTRVNLADFSGSNLTEYVPVINWKGNMYAVNLKDNNLFPIRRYRKNH